MQERAGAAGRGQTALQALLRRADPQARGWVLCALLALVAFRDLLRFEEGTPVPEELELAFFVPGETITPVLLALCAWLFLLRRRRLAALPAPRDGRIAACGVLGLGVYSGAYVSEIVRGSIQSIDKGQTMAALSLGMTPAQAMRQIVLPQAVVRMIPPLGNEFIALIKNSALVSLLTIHDVMHEGQKIISVSYRSLEVYLAIAVVYFVLTGTMTLVLRHFEQRLRQGGLVR